MGTPAPSFHPIVAAVDLLPALVWGIVAYHFWRLRRELQVRSTLFVIAPLLASTAAMHFVVHALIDLTPSELEGRLPGLHFVLDSLIHVFVILCIALFGHMVPTLAVPEEPRRPAWLAANYGLALVGCTVSLAPILVPRWWTREGWLGAGVAPLAIELLMVVLALRHARRLARRGTWHAGLAIGELRSPDVIVIAGALLTTGAMLLMLVVMGSVAAGSSVMLFLHTAMGLGIAVPFVVRMFGRVVRTFLASAATLVATAAIYFGAQALARGAASPELGRMIDVAAVAALALLVVPARAWLGAAIEHIVFRRGQRRQAQLQAFLHRLSPELGVVECCRRALAELGRVMHLRGAAILLRDGGTIVHGTFDARPIERVWPRGAAADSLPEHTFSEGDLLRGLPSDLHEALLEAEVVWTAPITSPRRRWGSVLATEGLLTTPSSSEDAAEITGFVGQLALVLDAAELLARAVAVERSLAHAEKLAAIGETAARIAHDIRNPLAAARSLAQQLARDPAAGRDAEPAELILAELERVERQVASLLRFARREEFRLEPVDLTALVQATVEAVRPRLEATGIAVVLEAGARVGTRADTEKLRQVLLNLLDNAADALAGAGDGRITVAVSGGNGTVSIRVTDSGPGVSPEALPRLFEPFFSLKAHGTGLGLAIARRTVDAHGGRIAAIAGRDRGMTFEIELPAERA